MARRPAHIAAAKPTGNQAIWAAMRKFESFTLSDLELHSEAERSTVREYLKRLVKGGFVREAGSRTARSQILGRPQNAAIQAKVYDLVRDVGAEAPRLREDGSPCLQGRARDHMWRTMKMLTCAGDFNFRDLAISASTREVAVSEVDARHYIKHLLGAGYLAVTRAATSKRPARYRLIRNTGPRAPMVQRLKTVFDPNLGKIVWHEEGDR